MPKRRAKPKSTPHGAVAGAVSALGAALLLYGHYASTPVVVVFVLDAAGQNVLVLLRPDGRVALPGGKVEPGDAAAATAAARELWEETGLEALSAPELITCEGRSARTRSTFLVRAWGGTLKAGGEGGEGIPTWVPIAHLLATDGSVAHEKYHQHVVHIMTERGLIAAPTDPERLARA